MPRSKEDFLDYARNARRKSNRPTGATEYTPDNNEGDADPSLDIRGATSSDDGAAEVEYRSEQAEQRTDSWTPASIENSNGNKSTDYTGDSGGVEEFDGSGYDSPNVDGGYDLPIRNYSSVDYQPYQPVQQSGKRTRVSFLDGLLKKGTDRQKSLPAQKAITATRRFITLAEVAKYKPGMIRLIMFSSDHMDDGITAITKGHQPVSIWSTIETPDAEILADAFLEAGQKSAAIAEKVRWVMEWEKKVKVGIILAPRIYRSIVYTVITGISVQL